MKSGYFPFRHFSGVYGRAMRRSLTVPAVALFLLMWGCSDHESDMHQEKIHEMGAGVMPFDLGKTRHIFEMTETGGIQSVVVRDRKKEDGQIPLIRMHLRKEAVRFAGGDFSDPLSLHGKTMPGVKDLESGHARVRIQYRDLPDGGRISFETTDIRLVTAIHRWFGAQLSDHGPDATYR